MKVLHSETYSRAGNDAWLIDKIQIISEDGELILRHKIDYKGWNGDEKNAREIYLDEFDTLEQKQERVNQYMINSTLAPEMKTPNLEELLNEN